MKEIVFATNNAHKLNEIREILGDRYKILSLHDINCNEEIEETATTLEGNAEIKARYVKQHYGYDCFADDTGLEVDVLDGAPGVYSARYASPGHDSLANMNVLLDNMKGKENRKARFRTVIALIQEEQLILNNSLFKFSMSKMSFPHIALLYSAFCIKSLHYFLQTFHLCSFCLALSHLVTES